MMIVYIIIGLLVLCALYVMLTYNGFIRLRNSVHESFSTMDVYLKKRYDLVPNLVESVKGYAAHEKETLEKVVQARNMAMGAASKTNPGETGTPEQSGMEERRQNEAMLSGALKSLFALSESYPNLKADSQFLDLQQQLKKIEEDIAHSRKYYNAVVKEMNTKVESFPANIIAGMFKFVKAPFFNMEESERGPVAVKF